jgi:hypothetical protein
MDQLESGEQHKTYVLQMKDGRGIVSDNVTFADSMLVLHNVIVEGKRTGIEPDSIPLGKVESVATSETNWIVTAIVLAPIVSRRHQLPEVLWIPRATSGIIPFCS